MRRRIFQELNPVSEQSLCVGNYANSATGINCPYKDCLFGRPRIAPAWLPDGTPSEFAQKPWTVRVKVQVPVSPTLSFAIPNTS